MFKLKILFYLSFLAALIFNADKSFSINKEKLDTRSKMYSDDIKSMRMHLDEWEVSYPVLNINGNNALLFSFDLMESDSKEFFYTIIHCNADWTPSRLMFFEYAEGFEENTIYDYSPSHSTILSYTNYHINIPGDDILLKKSGNYLLVVYIKDNNEKKIICTQRFMVYEDVLGIEGRVNATADLEYRNAAQKLDFTLYRQNLNINNPFRDLTIVIMQNFQWHNKITGIEPSFIDNEKLVYEFEERNRFRASNEYRYFTFHDLERLSERVKRIDFRHPYYYIQLRSDNSNLFSSYRSTEDINGHYVIHTRRFGTHDNPEVEADYGLVDFTLNYYPPIDNANVYIFGALSNWEICERFRMTYDIENATYNKMLLLKQAYYNYRYVVVFDNEPEKPDHTFLEGSHFETENDYLLFVYYREPGRSYDRLVGYKKFNSRNQ